MDPNKEPPKGAPKISKIKSILTRSSSFVSFPKSFSRVKHRMTSRQGTPPPEASASAGNNRAAVAHNMPSEDQPADVPNAANQDYGSSDFNRSNIDTKNDGTNEDDQDENLENHLATTNNYSRSPFSFSVPGVIPIDNNESFKEFVNSTDNTNSPEPLGTYSSAQLVSQARPQPLIKVEVTSCVDDKQEESYNVNDDKHLIALWNKRSPAEVHLSLLEDSDDKQDGNKESLAKVHPSLLEGSDDKQDGDQEESCNDNHDKYSIALWNQESPAEVHPSLLEGSDDKQHSDQKESCNVNDNKYSIAGDNKNSKVECSIANNMKASCSILSSDQGLQSPVSVAIEHASDIGSQASISAVSVLIASDNNDSNVEYSNTNNLKASCSSLFLDQGLQSPASATIGHTSSIALSPPGSKSTSNNLTVPAKGKKRCKLT
ncbi:hypothetical protein BD408DRAFT_17375 [Parasitella parasitica]|nr:hypothetical protein BD408DRAFT_17375 [Parasitella parasitica]